MGKLNYCSGCRWNDVNTPNILVVEIGELIVEGLARKRFFDS